MRTKSPRKLLFLLILALAFSCCIQHPSHPIESIPTLTKTPAKAPLTETPIEPVETLVKKQIKLIITVIAPSPTPLATFMIHTPTPFKFEFGKKHQVKVIRVTDREWQNGLV